MVRAGDTGWRAAGVRKSCRGLPGLAKCPDRCTAKAEPEKFTAGRSDAAAPAVSIFAAEFAMRKHSCKAPRTTATMLPAQQSAIAPGMPVRGRSVEALRQGTGPLPPCAVPQSAMRPLQRRHAGSHGRPGHSPDRDEHVQESRATPRTNSGNDCNIRREAGHGWLACASMRAGSAAVLLRATTGDIRRRCARRQHLPSDPFLHDFVAQRGRTLSRGFTADREKSNFFPLAGSTLRRVKHSAAFLYLRCAVSSNESA